MSLTEKRWDLMQNEWLINKAASRVMECSALTRKGPYEKARLAPSRFLALSHHVIIPSVTDISRHEDLFREE